VLIEPMAGFDIVLSAVFVLVFCCILLFPPGIKYKCNTDGAYIANSATSSCGGIFRDSNAKSFGCLLNFVVMDHLSKHNCLEQ